MSLQSCDTNILLHALNLRSPHHQAAKEYVEARSRDSNFRICEFVLVELYVLLRNPAVLSKPLAADKATQLCVALRSNPCWGVLDCPGATARIMDQVWQAAAAKQFARRRIFDARLAYILLHYGVSQFATQNVKDFQDFGFASVFDPLQ